MTDQDIKDAKKFTEGYTCSHRIKLVEVVDGRFFIFHHPSHAEYTDRMSGVKTCQGFHCIIDKRSPVGYFNAVHVFGKVIHKVYGRYSKAKREELIKKAQSI